MESLPDCPAIVMKTLYHDVNEALQRAITVLLSEIRPNRNSKWPGLTYSGQNKVDYNHLTGLA